MTEFDSSCIRGLHLLRRRDEIRFEPLPHAQLASLFLLSVSSFRTLLFLSLLHVLYFLRAYCTFTLTLGTINKSFRLAVDSKRLRLKNVGMRAFARVGVALHVLKYFSISFLFVPPVLVKRVSHSFPVPTEFIVKLNDERRPWVMDADWRGALFGLEASGSGRHFTDHAPRTFLRPLPPTTILSSGAPFLRLARSKRRQIRSRQATHLVPRYRLPLVVVYPRGSESQARSVARKKARHVEARHAEDGLQPKLPSQIQVW